MQQNYQGPAKGKILYNFIANNPLHILGVSCCVSRKDILKKQERFLKMAKLGSQNMSSEFTFNAFSPSRDIESLQKAVQQIANIDYRLFWFSDNKFIEELNKEMNFKALDNTNIENFDVFLQLIYFQYLNSEKVHRQTWETIFRYISDFRRFYPCFDDLYYFEKRFQEIGNDGIPIYGSDIYARLFEIIDLPVTTFIKQLKRKDFLIELLEILNKLGERANFIQIFNSIYEQISYITRRDIEEFSNKLSKFLDNDYECNDNDFSSILSIFESHHERIKSSIAGLTNIKEFPSHVKEELKNNFLTNHVKIAEKAYSQSKYKVFSKIMTLLGEQSTISLIKDLTFLKKEYSLLKKGESKVEINRKHGHLRKDDLAILENRDDFILFIALKAYGEDSQCQRYLGYLYNSEENDFRTKYKVPYNPSIAFEWWMKAAKQNDAEAQFSVSLAFIEGKGTYQDRRESIYWLKKAASNGHEEAISIVLKNRL